MQTTIHSGREEILTALTGRKLLYSFLSSLFKAPLSYEDYETIRKNLLLEDLYSVSEGAKRLKEFFSEVNSHAAAEVLRKEREEFNRLFVGPDVLPAPPWESVYRSKEQLLFDQSTLEVREKLHRFGLQYAKENQEPEDHVSVELEFMAWLIERTEQSLQGASDETLTFSEAQIEFLTDHLIHWIPEFTSRLLAHTSSLLYSGAAELLRDFIELDLELSVDLKEGLSHG